MKAIERIEIQTDRLNLRRYKIEDAEVLFKNYTSDSECSTFLQRKAHTSVEQTAAMLKKWCYAAWDLPETPFGWIIAERNTNYPIGVFLVIPENHKSEIHFGICKSHWGQGLTAEAGRAILEVLWNCPGTKRLWTFCDLDNVGSRRVIEKIGMEREGILRKWLVLPSYGNAARDCYVYSSVKI